jgi:8-hydroxy-5-deazaflavin:NADPH oxidoreductase
MKIGILGAGSIGSTLARKLAAAGHEVKVANSRGPETIGTDILTTGATAVNASDVVQDVEVLITSIPLSGMPAVKPLVARLPTDAVVIDTSNYYPARDGRVQALEEGQIESLWITEQLGRSVAKAWNAILSGTFEAKGVPAGDPTRLAIPVAADRDADRETAMILVEDTGFDAVDAGTLADSWRQQPGAPVYCTELTREEMPSALAVAEKDVLPERRDKAMAAISERVQAGSPLTVADLVALNRVIYR